jgi:pimeloyl-ACP methyl ester carboxylesterase
MQFRIDDVDLHCETIGEGAPLLFIHGFPLCGTMWLPAARRLPPGWRAIVPDLRGHGRSGASSTVTIERFAADLAALLDALDERRPAVVCGLSMGGIIAFEFFRRYRPCTRALILADTRANPESPEGVARREALAQAALERGSAAAVDMMIDQVFARSVPQALKDKWRAVMHASPPAGVAAAARALATRPDSSATLAQIDCPALVVCGEEDELTPPAMMRAMHAAIPGSQFTLIRGAGHLPPVETPEAFAAAVGGFLRTLPPPVRV